MNYLDITIIIIIAIFTIRGLFRGLITELMTLVALILGFFIAVYYLQPVAQFLVESFPSLPEFAARIIGFIVLFFAVNLIVRLLSKLLNSFASLTFLQPFNKIAGGIFGFVKTVLVLSILLIMIDFLPGSDTLLNAIGKENSAVYGIVKGFAPNIYNFIVAFIPGNEKLYDQIIEGFKQADTTAKKLINF
ncbi:MAG: CvpA family protein [Calditrichaceae bacterium]